MSSSRFNRRIRRLHFRAAGLLSELQRKQKKQRLRNLFADTSETARFPCEAEASKISHTDGADRRDSGTLVRTDSHGSVISEAVVRKCSVHRDESQHDDHLIGSESDVGAAVAYADAPGPASRACKWLLRLRLPGLAISVNRRPVCGLRLVARALRVSDSVPPVRQSESQAHRVRPRQRPRHAGRRAPWHRD